MREAYPNVLDTGLRHRRRRTKRDERAKIPGTEMFLLVQKQPGAKMFAFSSFPNVKLLER